MIFHSPGQAGEWGLNSGEWRVGNKEWVIVVDSRGVWGLKSWGGWWGGGGIGWRVGVGGW